MSQLIIYSSTDDGSIRKTEATYTEAHDEAEGIIDDSDNSWGIGLVNMTIYRGFVFFDASDLPTNAIITKVILSLRVESKANIDEDFDIIIQSGQPTYPHEPLVVGDYLYSHYSGNGGSINTTDTTDEAYFHIELNSSGRAWIRGGESTKLCLRSNMDIDDTGDIDLPGGEDAYISIHSVEKGAGFKPYLTIDYTDFAAVERTIKAEAEASSGDIASVGGKRTLEINNHLIQDTTTAQAIADAYLADYKDQKTKLVITRPCPAPYEIGDTIERSGARIPYAPAVSAEIPYAPAATAVIPYGLAGHDMLIRKINISFSAGNYVGTIELEG